MKLCNNRALSSCEVRMPEDVHADSVDKMNKHGVLMIGNRGNI